MIVGDDSRTKETKGVIRETESVTLEATLAARARSLLPSATPPTTSSVNSARRCTPCIRIKFRVSCGRAFHRTCPRMLSREPHHNSFKGNLRT